MEVRFFRGADIGLTDNYLAIAKVRVKLMETDKRKTNRLKNETVREEFTSRLERNFQDRGTTAYNGADTEAKWNMFQEGMTEAVKAFLGIRNNGREEWMSEETWSLINEKKSSKSKS